MTEKVYNVLFICTHNSARSIIAEGLLNSMSHGRFVAYSAGSQPTGSVNPYALKTLERMRIPTDGYRSKDWTEFARPGAPAMDFVFTVCDNAAGEVCPAWPGQPITAHWGVSDPAAVEGDKAHLAFTQAFVILQRRIGLFTSLRPESLDRLMLQNRVREIGETA